MKCAHQCRQWPLVAILALLLVINLKGWNTPVFLAMQQMTRYLPDYVWANLTLLGDTLAALALVAILSRYDPRLLWFGLWTLLIAACFIHTGKLFFQLPRPATVLAPETLHIIGPSLYYRAFPSGHALTAFALAGLLLTMTSQRLVQGGILLLAGLVACSRVAVGAHWPADLIAGAALGWLAAGWGVRLGQRWLTAYQPRMQALLLLALGVCMVLLLGHDSGYPGVTALQLTLASIGLWQLLRQLSDLAVRATQPSQI